MDKKENNIAKNTSSGAEKVENIGKLAQEKAAAYDSGDKGKTSEKRASGTAGKAAGEKSSVKTGAGASGTKNAVGAKKTSGGTRKGSKEKTAATKEKAAAKKRVDAALAREERKARKAELKEARKAKRAEMKAERKAKHAQKRLEMKEKYRERMAAMKEKRAERKAERIARKELLRSETAAQRIARIEKERADRLAARQQKREQAYNLKLEKRDARLKKREQQLKDRQHRRETRRTPGFGGWLAAVISLGVVTLALTAVVTVGAIDIARSNTVLAGSYRGTLYELVGIVDALDSDLAKARIVSTPSGQTALLTDVLVQARLAESSLERFPIDSQADANVTSFINRAATTSEQLLSKLRSGGTLTEEDAAAIERLYRTNRIVRDELNRLAIEMTDKEMQAFMKEKDGNRVYESFRVLENSTAQGAEDGPFAEEAKETAASDDAEEKKKEISSSEAEEKCRGYFRDYAITEAEYAGEATAKDLSAYNFFLRDDRGRQLFAQVAKKNGALVSFEFYEHCSAKNFDLERAKMIAEDYLAGLGYENMTAVWVSEGGATASFNFAYEVDGTVYYPDLVKVKVCETKGKVVGFDATAFLKNHAPRAAASAKITLGEAQEKLNEKLNVRASRLTVIPVGGREIAAYEFLCECEGETYFVYVDAETGGEACIYSVRDTRQGRMLA